MRTVCAALLGCAVLAAQSPQTRVKFSQIRNWQQISPNEILADGDPYRRPGVALSQLAWNGEPFTAAWRVELQNCGNSQVRVSFADGQINPILLSSCFSMGPCCDQGVYWFGDVVPKATVAQTGPASLSVQVADGTSCQFVLNSDSMLVEVFWINKQVAVMAGSNTGDRYVPTAERVSITGPCASVDVDVDPISGYHERTPAGIQQWLWFGVAGSPTPDVPLTGVSVPGEPQSYGVDALGLRDVRGRNWEIILRPWANP